MERITAQCHLHAVPRFIPATYENFAVAATTALITLNTNYCVVVLKCLALSTTLILANSTELNGLAVLPRALLQTKLCNPRASTNEPQ